MKMIQCILNGRINKGGQNIYAFYRQHIEQQQLPDGRIKRIWHEPKMALHRVHGDGTFEVQDIKMNRTVLKHGLLKQMWELQDQDILGEILEGARIKQTQYIDVNAGYYDQIDDGLKLKSVATTIRTEKQKETMAKARLVAFENRKKRQEQMQKEKDEQNKEFQRVLLNLKPEDREKAIEEFNRQDRYNQESIDEFNKEINSLMELNSEAEAPDLIPGAIGE